MKSAVAFSLNGQPTRLEAPPLERLSDALRERCGLTGVKVGCNAGDCGACTVLIDDEPVAACMTAIAQVEDRCVTTIEGLLDSDPVVSSLRAAFHPHGAAQCGMCTPAALPPPSRFYAPIPPLPKARSPTDSAACSAAAPAIARFSTPWRRRHAWQGSQREAIQGA